MKNYVQKIVRRLGNTNPTKIRHSEMGDWGCITYSVVVAIVVCVFRINQEAAGGRHRTQNTEHRTCIKTVLPNFNTLLTECKQSCVSKHGNITMRYY